jgi:lipopolysaccharide export system ATP-binding protein
MNTLNISNLEKRYKKRQVVKDISLKICSNEVVGLLGPNGAGKTTCFYMIVGLVKANSGSIFLNSTNITSMPMHERARKGLSYLPQEPSIFRKLTVADNIMAILQLQKGLNTEKRQQILTNLMEELHVAHLANNLGISLSGGERRRVEIARALATNPKFILLDEPFAGIDPISIVDIKQIITHLKNRGLGILITDHNVKETLDICQRAYIVSDGSIIAEGAPSEILQNQQVRKVYLGEEFDL